MRLRLIAGFATLALASASVLLAYMAQQPIIHQPNLRLKVDHPVTDAMSANTAARARNDAPAFAVKDFAGSEVVIAGPAMEKPQFVYFVMDGCPCSVEVEPLFQDLWKRHNKSVEFIGVIEKDAKIAREWHTEKLMKAAMVPDPKHEIIQAYGATNSVFSAYIDRNGKIVKMWPGYSAEILNEMNDLFAEAGKTEPKPFDTKWAPKDPRSGCQFTLE